MPSSSLHMGDLVALVETPLKDQPAKIAKLEGLEGIARCLGVDIRQGLDANDTEDLKMREDAFGKNYVAPPKAKSFFELMWDAFQDLTIIVLTCSGVFSIVLEMSIGEHKETGWIEGTCIIFAVCLVTVVTAVNDYQKEQQFRELNAVKEDEKIKVIRNGEPTEVSKFNLLVGDIVRVDLGDIVPADGLVFDEKELKLDESAMTGETDLLTKNAQNPFLLSGTKVMEGLGKMLVVAVGENSQAGIISKLIAGKKDKKQAESNEVDGETYVEIATPKEVDEDDEGKGKGKDGEYGDDEASESPLQGKLNRLTILIGKLGTAVALLVFVVMCIRYSIKEFVQDHNSWSSSYISEYLAFFIIAITVLVVAIPEGLPLAVTIALAYSVKKMLKDNNLVRHLDACETMGSATTICSDKTGTLTTNRMTVMQLWMGHQEFATSSEAFAAMASATREAFADGICVNSTAEILPPKQEGGQPEHTGNKTECALLQFVVNGGVQYADVRQSTDVAHLITFSSAKKRMSAIVRTSLSSCRVYTKGASEVVLGLCDDVQQLDGAKEPLNAHSRDHILSVITKYASQGYRTLCLAYRDIPVSADEVCTWSDDDIEKDLTCVGVVGIEDPVRPEVPGAIESCRRAGITVRMVTGDNITTARSIAGKCGIISNGDGSLVMEGHEFRSRVLDAAGNIVQSEFDKIWPMLRVLARSSPKDKYTLVTGLMQTTLIPHGPQVVAVTGDGTNDAPALKKANVGFAMGVCGTAVAKDASDIILMDDNFSSIVNAIKWGRNVYDSIAKFLQFQLTVNVVAIVVAVLGAVGLDQSPLTAVQMLWVNLIMDSFASLALATEEPSITLLERKPYPKTQPLLSKKMTKHIIGQSVLQMIVLLVLMFAGDEMFGVSTGIYDQMPKEAGKIARSKKDPSVHMTIVFNVFVWLQLFNELNCRKIHDEKNIFAGITRNPIFLYVCILQVVMQVVIVQWTGRFFGCAPLTLAQYVICIVIGALSLPWGLFLRWISVKGAPSWMAVCRGTPEEGPLPEISGRGQELWIRGFARVRTQIRVIRAFKKGLETRALLTESASV